MPFPLAKRRIGLLGGSFNPAHAGHLHLTRYAIKRLKLDEVWWLVSPQNPLKSTQHMAQFKERLASARRLAKNERHIHVSDIEMQMGTRYSYEIVGLLQTRYPKTDFIWLMGADNLAQLHRWKRWQYLLRLVPVAIFDRAPYSHRALRSNAASYAHRFFSKNRPISYAMAAPALLYFPMPRHPLSSTELRKCLEKGHF